jgi:iron(III) transport system permease protein
VIAIAAVAFMACCALPALYMFGAAVSAIDAGVVLDARQRGLFYNTTLLGLSTAVVATLIGAPLGFAFARVAFRFKMALRLVLIAPALLPPYVVALAWMYLDAHVSTRMLGPVGRILFDPYSLAGAVVTLAVVFYPVAMLTTEVSLRRLESRLEEAALVAAPPHRVLWRISRPLIAPSVLSAALLIFVLAISEFSVPGLLRVRVFTTEVFTAFASLYDFSRATALALPLLGVSMIIAASAGILVSRRLVATRRGAWTPSPVAFATWQRGTFTAIMSVVVGLLLVLLTALAFEAFRSDSITNVVQGSGDAIAISLLSAAVGATLVTGLAVFLGYARARTTPRIGLAVDISWVVLFAIPSTLIGVGLIGLWNRPGIVGAVYGTDAMLVVGYLARFTPVAALAVAATIRSVPASQEEAGAVAGASWLRTMFRIVLPQVRLGLVAIWVISFILAFGEVGTSILVAPPGESTLPIRVYTLTANAPPGHIAALALFQSAVILCPLALLGITVARRPRR